MKKFYRYLYIITMVLTVGSLSCSGVVNEEFVDISGWIEENRAAMEEAESHAEEQRAMTPEEYGRLASGGEIPAPTQTPQTPAPAAPAQNQAIQAATTQTSTTAQTNNSSTPTTVKAEPTEEEIAAAWVETERVEPTCTEAGYTTRTNSITGEVITEEIPATGHSYSETNRVEATCTADGKITYTCATCGDTYDEVILAKGHTEGDPQVTEVKATLFKDGYTLTEVYCTECGELLSSDKVIYPAMIPVWARIAVPAALVVCAGVIAVVIGIQRKRNKINGID